MPLNTDKHTCRYGILKSEQLKKTFSDTSLFIQTYSTDANDIYSHQSKQIHKHIGKHKSAMEVHYDICIFGTAHVLNKPSICYKNSKHTNQQLIITCFIFMARRANKYRYFVRNSMA